jgi:hypothetical protein
MNFFPCVSKFSACGNPVHLLCSVRCMVRDFFLAARGGFRGQSDLVGDTREGLVTLPASLATLATQGNARPES